MPWEICSRHSPILFASEFSISSPFHRETVSLLCTTGGQVEVVSIKTSLSKSLGWRSLREINTRSQAKLPICDLPLYGLLLLTSKRARDTGNFVTLLPHDPRNYTLSDSVIQSLLLTFLAWVTVNFKISGVPSETLLPSQRDQKGQLSQWFRQTLFARHLFSRNKRISRARYSFSRLISLLLCDLSDSTVFSEVIQTPKLFASRVMYFVISLEIPCFLVITSPIDTSLCLLLQHDTWFQIHNSRLRYSTKSSAFSRTIQNSCCATTLSL